MRARECVCVCVWGGRVGVWVCGWAEPGGGGQQVWYSGRVWPSTEHMSSPVSEPANAPHANPLIPTPPLPTHQRLRLHPVSLFRPSSHPLCSARFRWFWFGLAWYSQPFPPLPPLLSAPPQNFRPGPGRVSTYLAPGGPHVRMDSHLYPDYLVRRAVSGQEAGGGGVGAGERERGGGGEERRKVRGEAGAVLEGSGGKGARAGELCGRTWRGAAWQG